MAKRWTKQKAGKQKGKTRKRAQARTERIESSSGTMGSFRRGLKAIAGGGDGKQKSGFDRAVNILLWVAVVVAAVFAYRRCS